MERGSKLWRVAAFLLLFVSALNFVNFDLQARTPFSPTQSSSDDACPGSSHDCFACCGHIVLAAPPEVVVQFQLINLTDEGDPKVFPTDPLIPFHPPKA
ncbi:MAG: hypothetical protein LC114_04905 [Bryobacterales bacterium]|nr:hypothetical protein [Bryobacterales bacterium]